jgi:hypothetical protein
MPSRFPSLSVWIILAALIPALAGCASTPHQENLTSAVETGERPVSMQGSANFFEGKVSATITISRGVGRGTLNGSKAGTREKREDDDLKDLDEDSTMAYLRAKGSLGSQLPPVTIHLKLANLSKETVSVDIHDFDSDLGNFAIRPEVLALAPDQISEPDPMVSQLGITSDRLPVKVTLQLGADKETQTIIVANILPPAKPGAN